MNFKVEINKEQLAVIGKGAGKVGKAILVEGTKAVLLKGSAAVIRQSFDGGMGSVKDLELDDLLNGGKQEEKKPKKALFSFKKKSGPEADLDVEVEVVEAEIVKPTTK